MDEKIAAKEPAPASEARPQDEKPKTTLVCSPFIQNYFIKGITIGAVKG